MVIVVDGLGRTEEEIEALIAEQVAAHKARQEERERVQDSVSQ